MENKRTKVILYLVMVIIGYYIIGLLIDYLVLAVMWLLVWRVYDEYQKNKIEIAITHPLHSLFVEGAGMGGGQHKLRALAIWWYGR